MSHRPPERHGATPAELRERVLAERRGEPFLPTATATAPRSSSSSDRTGDT